MPAFIIFKKHLQDSRVGNGPCVAFQREKGGFCLIFMPAYNYGAAA